MSQAGEAGGGNRPESSANRSQTGRNNTPLVIVSERGRHSDESRRIVRAQAARASAAQSRVTRARNREGRESGHRETPLASPTTEEPQPPLLASESNKVTSLAGAFTRPFSNPVASATVPAPQQPAPPDPPAQLPVAESTGTSYVGSLGRSLGNTFGLTGGSQDQQQQQIPPPRPALQLPAQPQAQPSQPTGTDEAPGNSTTRPITDALTVPFSAVTQKPLVIWLAALLNMSATSLFEQIQSMPATLGQPALTGAAAVLSTGGAVASGAVGSLQSMPASLAQPSVAGAANALSASGALAGGAVSSLGRTSVTGATTALTSGGAFASGAVGSLAGAVQDTGGGFGRIFSTATGASQGSGGFGSAMPGSISTPGTGKDDPGVLQLPRALPRGFVSLQQRVSMSEPLLGLLTRTSCFDFGSPGVETRIHRLLFDLIIGYLTAAISPFTRPSHPIQDHLRIACTCLTIFQGQRANGQVLAEEPTYDKGLEAAWSEVKLLDQKVLTDSQSAEASLWAVFVISVTTGPATTTADFFHQLLQGLCQDLQLQYWSQVRKVLLDFIYPVSFLDEPCKAFWDKMQGFQVGVV